MELNPSRRGRVMGMVGAGLLLGVSYPLGVLVAAPGLLFAWGSAAQFAFVVPGAVLGSLGWLGLPVWPLLLAKPLGNCAVDPPPRAS